MGKIIIYVPRDEMYLVAVKKVCPEYYDKALENYLKKKVKK